MKVNPLNYFSFVATRNYLLFFRAKAQQITLFILLCCFVCLQSSADTMPRVVLAFYDSELIDNEIDGVDGLIAQSNVHRAAEMPLNHLGLMVRYRDIHEALPAQADMSEVRGILFWLDSEYLPQANQILQWLIQQIAAGIPVVVMGNHSFEAISANQAADPKLVEEFWAALGVTKDADWALATYDIKLTGSDLTAFERDFTGAIPQFPMLRVRPGQAKTYLEARQQSSATKVADLITVSKSGAYVAPGFARIFSPVATFDNDKRHKRHNPYWYVNPFRLFELAFATHGLPRPDTTTLTGRRIYYSHIDGDGWRNVSLIPEYREAGKFSSEVVLNEIFSAYPDLPVTVAPVAGDLDNHWFGTKRSSQVARDIFQLEHIEAGSHSYCHPLSWGFFRNYQAEFEQQYLPRYPEIPGQYSFQTKLKSLFKRTMHTKVRVDTSVSQTVPVDKNQSQSAMEEYATPRAYYNGPYDLQQDIQGSIDFIESLLPEGKRVELFHWSGNTLAIPEALKLTRAAGIRNLNGGDTRFDAEFDSLNWVSPIGRASGDQQQIYASASNENTYTYLWTDRFYGFSYLTETFRRTESPIRLKPMNIYYHMYIGERQASLHSLKHNLDYARTKSIAPVAASRFAAIGDGFFSTQLQALGERRWQVLQRGALQTIRFDQATFDAVDFTQSEGVLGQSHLQGSLYVALDPSHQAPIIALKTIDFSHKQPLASRAYLGSSRWWVEGFKQQSEGFQFQARGFGAGEMQWFVPQKGQYMIAVERADGTTREWQARVGEDNKLTISLVKSPIKAVTIKISKIGKPNASI